MDPSKGRLWKGTDFDPADLRVDESHRSTLELRFHEKVPEDELKLLLPIVQGLMRFMPSERTSALQALDIVRVLRHKLADKATLSH